MKNYVSLIIFMFIINSCSTESPDWMQVNRESIDNKNITQIPIAGSYLANAYSIHGTEKICSGELSPTAQSANAKLKDYLSAKNQFNSQSFISHLNTQNYDISEQLSNGIRYLDIQVCQQNANYYTSNYFLTAKISKISSQIIRFIKNHPEEIIIIDLNNNLWAENGYMNDNEIINFHTFLEKEFDGYLLPKNMKKFSIGEIKKSKYRIIILSSSDTLTKFDDIWDKNQTTISIPNDFSAIKKISALQIMQEQIKSNTDQNKFIILPVYDNLSINDLMRTENKINNNMVLNYIQRSKTPNAAIIMLDKNLK